ncbi:ATP-binding protein [Acetivibrio clariflavus]|nr:ATP-binding protein [Acetivibrio clariflavus]
MEILVNISIRKRLIAILLIWIVTFICSGVFAIVKMMDISNITESMFSYSMQVSNAAAEARADIFKMEKELNELLITEDKVQLQNKIKNIENTDKRIMDYLDKINRCTTIAESLSLGHQAKEIFNKWSSERRKAEKLILDGELEQASRIIYNTTPEYVEQLEYTLTKIEQNSKNKANELCTKARYIVENQKNNFKAVIAVLCLISILFFIMITNSILKPINTLKKAMDESTSTGNLTLVQLSGKNEIVDMTNNYNVLVSKLKDMFWVKDTQNKLSQELSGCKSIDELTRKALNYVADVVSAGKGLLYLYDSETNMLYMTCTYAFTQQDKLYEKIAVGEGIIGQVAFLKKSILLNNISKTECYISTGIADETPLNTYTLPLIYEDELYGVISLASFEYFDKTKLEVLNECSKIIAANLYSAIQTQKIVDLLNISEKATKEACKSADELKATNAKLQHQQELLRRQAEELQKTNKQLERQQHQLEEQARILNTKNKQLEETSKELEKRTIELETTNRYKSQFLANMSHELKTPLNSIILLSKLLLNKAKGNLVDSDREKITIINKAGQELLNMINDILDLSKIEEGKMTINVQEIESSVIINEIRQMFEGVAREKQLDFFAEDLVNSKLRGDIHKISQILRNLVSNAIKFTEYGSVELKIIRDESNPKTAIFVVKDTGIGIAPEQQSIIFNEFQQGDVSISEKYGGTGLGLSISKRLAELLNGEIKVKSQIGIGSEFLLKIPNLIITTPYNYGFPVLPYLMQDETAVGSELGT